MNYFNPNYTPNAVQNLQTMFQGQTPLSMVSVSGIEGARAYQTQPNSAVPLFDNSKDLLYVKTTDGANYPTIKTFKLIPYDEQKEQEATFVSRHEFEQFKAEIKSAIKGNKKPIKGKDDDE